MKRTIARISKSGSVVWLKPWPEIDIKTLVSVQMLAEEVARYQSEKAFMEGQDND